MKSLTILLGALLVGCEGSYSDRVNNPQQYFTCDAQQQTKVANHIETQLKLDPLTNYSEKQLIHYQAVTLFCEEKQL